MTQLFTCSYRAYASGMGQAVVTSLGLPKYRPEASTWPRCWLITPTWEQLNLDGEEFDALYTERLAKFGVCKIARTLERIAREHQAERLVLLCHELDPERCHRRVFAVWWLRTGEEINEAQ